MLEAIGRCIEKGAFCAGIDCAANRNKVQRKQRKLPRKHTKLYWKLKGLGYLNAWAGRGAEPYTKY